MGLQVLEWGERFKSKRWRGFVLFIDDGDQSVDDIRMKNVALIDLKCALMLDIGC